MTLAVFLSATSLYFAFRPSASALQARDSAFTAALVGSFYCAAGVIAIVFPGADWNDPEFEKPPQDVMFPIIVMVMWVGYALERRRIGGVGDGKKLA